MEFEDLDQRLAEGRTVVESAPVAASPCMTLRERFQRVMHYQHADKLPNFEFRYWAKTLPNWHEQGLPKWVNDNASAYDYFGIEDIQFAPVNTGLKLAWKSEVIEETEERTVYRDIWGALCEINRKGDQSIPHFLEFPVRDRVSWQACKSQLTDDADRYPADWNDIAESYRRRDFPLAINISSMIGVPRNLIGFNQIAMMVYQDPLLLEDIVETFCQCVERNIVRALTTVQFDLGFGWEDICFNSGPIVGLPFMRDVVAPRYRRITDLLHLHGVDLAQVDCDGNLTHVIPSMLAAGLNSLFPAEVNAGTDPLPLRRQYGKDLRFWGGVNKMVLRQDKAAVDRELTRLRPIVEEGGFIPTIDHLVPADASLDLYKHYLDRKREWFNVGGDPKY